MPPRTVQLTPDQRTELERITFECEASPATLRAYLAELVAQRALFEAVRHSRRLTPRAHAAVRAIGTAPRPPVGDDDVQPEHCL